jgi:hypothetical protein
MHPKRKGLLGGRMRAYFLFLTALVLLTALGVWWSVSGTEAGNHKSLSNRNISMMPPAGGAQSGLKGRGEAGAEKLRELRGGESEPSAVVPAPPLTLDPVLAVERIEVLEATGNRAHVDELLRYLDHPHESVRKRALSSILLLADRASAGSLRMAALKAEREERLSESSSLHLAANFLEKNQLIDNMLPSKSLAEAEAGVAGQTAASRR